ncbi:MAG TPA: ClbS/DfsB family four-helix bundle protein [Anaerolineales bacterium]|nr:ClbS/DfsB family four-helix bundle protein [Anaerolineales bacterium]
MADKQVLLQLIEKEYQEEESFIAGLSPEERSARGTSENWSAKDLIAHFNSWKMVLGENLRALAGGKSGHGPLDDDEENAATFEKFKDLSWEEVLAFRDRAIKLLHNQVEMLSSSRLESEDHFPWEGSRPLWRVITSTGYTHPYIHLVEHARKNGDSREAARLNEIMAQDLIGLDESPAWQGIVEYNLACHYSQSGEPAKAIAALKTSLAMNPDLIEWSKEDADLEPLRSKAEYHAIYG